MGGDGAHPVARRLSPGDRELSPRQAPRQRGGRYPDAAGGERRPDGAGGARLFQPDDRPGTAPPRLPQDGRAPRDVLERGDLRAAVNQGLAAAFSSLSSSVTSSAPIVRASQR